MDLDKSRPKLYLCITFWHETVQEMQRSLESLFKLDLNKTNSTNDLLPTGFDLEGEILRQIVRISTIINN